MKSILIIFATLITLTNIFGQSPILTSKIPNIYKGPKSYIQDIGKTKLSIPILFARREPILFTINENKQGVVIIAEYPTYLLFAGLSFSFTNSQNADMAILKRDSDNYSISSTKYSIKKISDIVIIDSYYTIYSKYSKTAMRVEEINSDNKSSDLYYFEYGSNIVFFRIMKVNTDSLEILVVIK
jgi:hypothetical protein